jgi:hypothetical protein
MGALLSTEIPQGSVLGSVKVNNLRVKFEKALKKVELSSLKNKKNPTIKYLFDMQERNAALEKLINEIQKHNSNDRLDRDILGKLESSLKKYKEETQKVSDAFGSKNGSRKKKLPKDLKDLKDPKIKKSKDIKPK